MKIIENSTGPELSPREYQRVAGTSHFCPMSLLREGRAVSPMLRTT